MVRRSMISILVIVCAVIFLAVSDLGAVMFSTPLESKDRVGDPVSASATFMLNPEADTISIILENLQPGMKDAGQLLTGLCFSLSTGQTSGILENVAGTARTLKNDRTFTDLHVSSDDLHWVLINNVDLPDSEKTGLRLDGLTGGSPQFEVIGPADGSKYSRANGSLKNSAHNPFFAGPAEFLVYVPGIDETTMVSDVTFSFGTQRGDDIGTSIPEPTTLAMLGFGLIGVGTAARRRMRKTARGN